MSTKSKNIKVVVLGDIGRSPRMQYHCLSLAEAGHKVDVIGYGETDPMDSVKCHPAILYHYLCPFPQIPIRLVNYVFKTIVQTINLLFLLFITTKSDTLILQNPPAIPSFIVCWLYSKLTKSKLIIDWHNYAHTIMALNAGKNHPLVKITKNVEINIGKKAYANFCVTKAMKDDLKIYYDINATTLYDRPSAAFKPISLEERHEFLLKFASTYDHVLKGETEKETKITKMTEHGVELKSPRPGILVSSTSWTEDEDFSVLLSALTDYESHYSEGNFRQLPELICIITGKGPLKKFYLKKISQLKFKNVHIITPWLDAGDYPLILASADLGVSLHTSSSGLDLPMKVVDMFGCGLPVCAYDFKCLNELVKHGENSYTFKTSAELSEQIMNWFEDFPNNNMQKQIQLKFKNELKSFQDLRWKENWDLVAARFFE